MTDYERQILNHYNISTPFPEQWPAEKDSSDASDDDLPVKSKNNTSFRRSKSRYSALDRKASGGRRSLVPGSQKTRDGAENLVQQDEPDPLGAKDSVVRVLRQRGLPVEDDTRLRNRFLLSSTTFSPALFLSQVHSEDTTQALIDGLRFLSQSIDQKSASLKVLVESNFERFVRAKATIDNVYTEMRNQASHSESQLRPTHSRHPSRTGGHFRNISGGKQIPSPGAGVNKTLPSDKTKNALVKESEYGVQGIKAPLLEVAVKAEEVWGPALGGREREENLRLILESIEKYRGVFEVGGRIADCIRRRDYENLVEEYRRARTYANNVRNIADTAIERRTRLSDAEVHEVIVTGRMWVDVEDQIEEVKRDIWRRLVGVQANLNSSSSGNIKEPHMELIATLLELGVQDNPIWVWLLSRYDHLKTKINATSERFKVEVEVLRRRLASSEPPSPKVIAAHLRSPARRGLHDGTGIADTSGVLELWEVIFTSLEGLLTTQGGILGEVIEFWDTSQSFIDGKTQMMLPVGIDGQSRRHHTLSTDGTRDLQRGAIELVDLIRDSAFSFFADPPVEDISLLCSPLPPQTPGTPKSATLPATNFKDSRCNLDLNNLPPPSPRTGEAWEKFAFWPPYSNSLSGVHYLSRILVLVGSAAGEMAAISSVGAGHEAIERLRSLVGGTRERCAQAVCAAWNKDAENYKLLEDWTRSTEKRDQTKMLSQFMAFENAILSGTQRILYIPDASSRSGSVEVVLPPPAKLLQLVRSQFVTSLYKAFSGMVENAEKSVAGVNDEWSQDPAMGSLNISNSEDPSRNFNNANVRKLLTLSNLQALRTEIVQHLVLQFESSFSVALTEESKAIRDVLAQIDARLFKTYTSPTVTHLSSLVKTGILAETWAPTTNRPSEVRPYVYETLLELVLVHTQVSTTAPNLTPTILSYLLEQTSLAFLDAFKQRKRYTLAALMQATLDVEFVAQTLNMYMTDRVANVQSSIYHQLDEGTDNEARMRLQNELPEMRAILKRLRDKTRAQFACFKKPRSSQRNRSETTNSTTTTNSRATPPR